MAASAVTLPLSPLDFLCSRVVAILCCILSQASSSSSSSCALFDGAGDLDLLSFFSGLDAIALAGYSGVLSRPRLRWSRSLSRSSLLRFFLLSSQYPFSGSSVCLRFGTSSGSDRPPDSSFRGCHPLGLFLWSGFLCSMLVPQALLSSSFAPVVWSTAWNLSSSHAISMHGKPF